MVYMNSEELKRIIPKWAAEIGKSEARLILLKQGMGYTTAVFLINGKYKSELKDRMISLLYKALGDYINKQP